MSRSKSWNISDLKSELSNHSEITQWVIIKEAIHRRERYFMADEPELEQSAIAIDQDREAQVLNVHAQIFVRVDDGAQQGACTVRLFMDEPLNPQVDLALKLAGSSLQQKWHFAPPSDDGEIPELQISDPEIAEDIEKVMEKYSHEVANAGAQKRSTDYASSELFLSIHDLEIFWSNGRTHRSSQTRTYSEVAYGFSGESHDEFVSRRYGLSVEDLEISKQYAECAELANYARQVGTPEPGHYHLLVDDEVLSALLNQSIGLLSAANRYNGLPYIGEGQPLVEGAQGGDLLTIRLDPTTKFGAASMVFAADGTVQKPLDLVSQNKVVGTIANQQYGQYIGLGGGTSGGNIVVEPGTHSYDELIGMHDRVLEIFQFSAIFVDPHSATFSSEIRLGRLHDRATGKSTIIKGGSVSASLFENFKTMWLSRETARNSEFSNFKTKSQVNRGDGYIGPKYALLSNVSVAS